VLVVSGLHIGFLAWVVSRLLGLMHIPSRATGLISALAVLFYARMVGFQASVSRCLWMFALYLAGRCAFRNSSPTNIGLASAFLLRRGLPDGCRDIGFQLSFVSVLAIVLAAAPVIREMMQPLLRTAAALTETLHSLPGLGAGRGTAAAGARNSKILRRSLRRPMRAGIGPALDRWSRGMAHLGCGWALRLLISGCPASGSLPDGILLQTAELVVPTPPRRGSPVSLALASATYAARRRAASAVAPGIWPAIWLASQLCWAVDFSRHTAGWQRCPTPLPPGSFPHPSARGPGLFWLAPQMDPAGWCCSNWPCLAAGLLAPCGFPAKFRHAFGARVKETSDAERLEMTFLDVGQGDCIVLRLPNGAFGSSMPGELREGVQRKSSLPSL